MWGDRASSRGLALRFGPSAPSVGHRTRELLLKKVRVHHPVRERQRALRAAEVDRDDVVAAGLLEVDHVGEVVAGLGPVLSPLAGRVWNPGNRLEH